MNIKVVVVWVLAMLVLGGPVAHAQRQCKGTKRLHKGKCLYPDEIQRIRRALKPRKPRKKKRRRSSVAGIRWVKIRGGRYSMGSTVGGGDERPIHPVKLHTFRMMKNEVTVDQYRACVTAGGCTDHHLGGYEWPGRKYSTSEFCNWPYSDRGSYPINCVDWAQARAFCAWAGGRLPTEAEWEYAARGRGLPREYPWGNEAATCARAIIGHKGTCTAEKPCGCGKNTTWPVCSKRAGNTVQGLCDMAGNVWEWVEDCWHNNYNGAPASGSAWTGGCVGTYRILRGGAGNRTTVMLRSAYRYRLHPLYRYDYLGVRCAK